MPPMDLADLAKAFATGAVEGVPAPTRPAPPPGPQTTAVVAYDPAAQAANALADKGNAQAERARRERFVTEYQRAGFNAVEAARKAGYPNPATDGPRVAKLPSVKKALAAAVSTQLSAQDYTAEWVLARVGATAGAEVADIWDPETRKIRTPDQLPDTLKRALKRARVVNGVWDYEFHDSLAAQALLTKIHGMQVTRSVSHSTVAHTYDLTKLRPEELDELLGLLPPDAAPAEDAAEIEDAEYEIDE